MKNNFFSPSALLNELKSKLRAKNSKKNKIDDESNPKTFTEVSFIFIKC